jgi:hypothetical protein
MRESLEPLQTLWLNQDRRQTYPFNIENDKGTKRLVFNSGAKAMGRSVDAHTRLPSSDTLAVGSFATNQTLGY